MTGWVVNSGFGQPQPEQGQAEVWLGDGCGGLLRCKPGALSKLQSEAHHRVRCATAQQRGDSEGSADGDVGPETGADSADRHCFAGPDGDGLPLGAVAAAHREVQRRAGDGDQQVRGGAHPEVQGGEFQQRIVVLVAGQDVRGLGRKLVQGPVDGKSECRTLRPAKVGDYGVSGLKDDK